MNDLSKRILQISYEKGLSHIGSCLTAAPIIQEIYAKKSPEDVFVLSSGHAGLALYCVLEDYYSLERGYYGVSATDLFDRHGVHPNRDLDHGIYCSAGSLGHGLPIALGMALADRSKKVYCLISDGECAEGSIWEALRVKVDNSMDNLEIHLNMNSWGAYDPIDQKQLIKRIKAFDPSVVIHKTKVPDWDFLTDPQEAHYKSLNAEEYAQVIK